MVIINLVVLGLLCLGAVIDLAIKKIPNTISLLILMLGIASNTYFPSGLGFEGSIYGALTGFVAMFFFYCVASLGAGDVKLMAALGSVVGIKTILYIATYSFILSGTYAFFYLIINIDACEFCKRIKLLLTRASNYVDKKPGLYVSQSVRMPMAPAIALSTAYIIYMAI